MKALYFILSVLIFSCLPLNAQVYDDSLLEKFFPDSVQSGDIVFQSSEGRQGIAIQSATKSKFNHCGMLYNEKGQWYVYEAVQPVCKTPLKEWINQGTDNKIAVMRYLYTDSSAFKDSAYKLQKQMKTYLGKNYDIFFGWGDDQLYCSELVWKLYSKALGIELCELRPFGDYDLSDPLVKAIIKERFGNKIPKDQLVVAPEDLYKSNLLKTVFNNFDRE